MNHAHAAATHGNQGPMHSKELSNLKSDLLAARARAERKPIDPTLASYACRDVSRHAPRATGKALCDWVSLEGGTTVYTLLGDEETVAKLAPGLLRHAELQLVSESTIRGFVSARRTQDDDGNWAWSIIGRSMRGLFKTLRWRGHLVDGYRKMVAWCTEQAEPEGGGE